MNDIRELEQAARSGNVEALRNVVLYYLQRMELTTARSWALEGTSINDPFCLHALGRIAENQQNYSEAFQWYRRNIEINEMGESASTLGFMCLNMTPVTPTNYEHAESCFQYALNKDANNADANLGMAMCELNKLNTHFYELSQDDITNRLNNIKNMAQKAYDKSSGETKEVARQLLAESFDFMKTPRQQKQPTQQNNGGGCFITTAVCESFGKSDDCYELSTFRYFRDNWLINQSDGKQLIEEYYSVAPKIVKKVNQLPNASEVYQSIWTEYLKACLSLIETQQLQECKRLYQTMVNNLRRQFLH